MLQIDVCPFASDALEDAMRLAQTKSLNSYTFSDCISFLNYVWSDIYSQICCIDSGYYSKTVQLTKKLTKLPKFVKNSIMVYAAQRPTDYTRTVFRQSGESDMLASFVYRISGTDLYCPDAERRNVWLEYCPQPAQIFFTHHNRDPKILEGEYEKKQIKSYGMYNLVEKDNKYLLEHKNATLDKVIDITEYIVRPADEDGEWELTFISCDYPYIFCSYRHKVSGEYDSGFFDKNFSWNRYNPFDWTGRKSNVEYLSCKYNDKTGMSVVVNDWNDMIEQNGEEKPRIKELGWTPDTKLIYPAPEVYRYLVARLAEKFAALNESNIMGVQSELADAKFAFQAFLKKDKSAWERIRNVNPATRTDWL